MKKIKQLKSLIADSGEPGFTEYPENDIKTHRSNARDLQLISYATISGALVVPGMMEGTQLQNKVKMIRKTMNLKKNSLGFPARILNPAM